MVESTLELKVGGELACFTRPEAKVERVSYPVMTPSAARGVLEAVFWKPEFTWRVREIVVLNPVKWFSLRRNEVKSRQTARAEDYYADDDRAQRHTLGLRDVEYVIRADIELKAHTSHHPAKYRDMFRRRVERGQCFSQPYLGCREFAARFEQPTGEERPFGLTMDLGLMLWDQRFEEHADGPIEYRTHGAQGAVLVRGRAEPTFFRAKLDHGVVRVPDQPEA